MCGNGTAELRRSLRRVEGRGGTIDGLVIDVRHDRLLVLRKGNRYVEFRLDGTKASVTFDPSGTRLVISKDDGELLVWSQPVTK